MGAKDDEDVDALDEGTVLIFSRSVKDKVTLSVPSLTSWIPPGTCLSATIRAMPEFDSLDTRRHHNLHWET